MPVIISESFGKSAEFDPIHPQTGNLTLEAQVISDFLTQLDSSALSGIEALDAFVESVKVEGEDGEFETVDVIPGELVAQIVDENDLAGMFVHYINELAESVFNDPDATLEQKARLAPFADLIDEAATQNIKNVKGKMKKLRKLTGGELNVQRQIGAMLKKGIIKRVKANTGYKSGDYTKTSAYDTGGTKAGKAKVARVAKANKAKAARMRQKSKVAAKESVENFDLADLPIYGVGTEEGVQYALRLVDDAAVRIEEAKKGKKGKMGKMGKMPKMPAPEADAMAMESVGAVRTVVEGASLAARMVQIHEHRVTPPAAN